MKTYEEKTTNINYAIQQRAIKKVCNDLNLVVYYPDYHGAKGDKNSVIIYENQEECTQNIQVCSFSNTDVNGSFNWGFLNFGKLDVSSYKTEYEIIYNYIVECLIIKLLNKYYCDEETRGINNLYVDVKNVYDNENPKITAKKALYIQLNTVVNWFLDDKNIKLTYTHIDNFLKVRGKSLQTAIDFLQNDFEEV